MRYENFKPDYHKPAIFSAQTYGTKTIVELDHSDLDLDEVMDVFKTLIVGMGYNMESFNQWVIEMADELKENQPQPNYDDEYQYLRHSTDDKPHWDWDDVEGPEESIEEARNKRMDIIGQNGNEGTHYYKDSEGFENYEDDYDEYGERIKPNKVLIDAKKQYDEQMKNEDNPISQTEYNLRRDKLAEELKKEYKKRKAKSVKDWEDTFDLGGNE